MTTKRRPEVLLAGRIVRPFAEALERLAGAEDGVRDGLRGLPQVANAWIGLPQGSWDWLEALADARADPNLGLHMAEAMAPGSLGLAESVFQCAPTLRDATLSVSQLLRLYYDGMIVELYQYPGTAEIALRCAPGTALPRHATEFLLATMTSIVRRSIGPFDYRSVRFRHAAPADVSELARFFGANLVFGHSYDGFEIDRKLLSRPLSGADPAMWRTLTRHAADEIARRESHTDELLAAYEQAVVSSTADVDTVARSMGLTVRTLQRRLERQGASHRELVSRARAQIARRRMSATPPQPLADTARELGFSSLSAFTRAFRRWTGMTPTQFCEQHSAVTPAKTSGSRSSPR